MPWKRYNVQLTNVCSVCMHPPTRATFTGHFFMATLAPRAILRCVCQFLLIVPAARAQLAGVVPAAPPTAPPTAPPVAPPAPPCKGTDDLIAISFDNAGVAHNNLGGLGPDAPSLTDEGIRLSAIGRTAGGRTIDLLISNRSAYRVTSTSENGLSREANGTLGQVALQSPQRGAEDVRAGRTTRSFHSQRSAALRVSPAFFVERHSRPPNAGDSPSSSCACAPTECAPARAVAPRTTRACGQVSYVELRFQLLDALTGAPIPLERFYLTFYDFDGERTAVYNQHAHIRAHRAPPRFIITNDSPSEPHHALSLPMTAHQRPTTRQHTHSRKPRSFHHTLRPGGIPC